MNKLRFGPIISSLASTLKLARSSDASTQRAIDRVLAQLQSGAIVYEFDGVELRVQSFSDRGETPKIYVSDGESCTCPHQPKPTEDTTCKHRVLFLLLLAELALTNPVQLRTMLLASAERQHAPQDVYGTRANDDDAALPGYAMLDTCRRCHSRLLDHDLPARMCDAFALPPRRPFARAEVIALPRTRTIVAAEELYGAAA